MTRIAFLIFLACPILASATDKCKYCDSLYYASQNPNANLWLKYQNECLKTDTVYYFNNKKVGLIEDANNMKITSKDACGIQREIRIVETNKLNQPKKTALSQAAKDSCRYCDSLLAISPSVDRSIRDKYRVNCVRFTTDFYTKDSAKVNPIYESYYSETIEQDICGTYYKYSLKSTNEKNKFQPVEFSISNGETIYTITDTPPEYVGGNDAMNEFFTSNLEYPEEAQRQKIEGIVWIVFIIEENGTVTNIKLLKGVHELLNREALRTIHRMPSWKPGKYREKPVRVRMKIPIKFAMPK